VVDPKIALCAVEDGVIVVSTREDLANSAENE